MAEYGEWNRKGATLSEVSVKKEYGVDSDFIIAGINSGKLEHRNGAIWGNPYLRILRSQLEAYIEKQLGKKYLLKIKNESELKKIKREITAHKKRITILQKRKTEIEKILSK